MESQRLYQKHPPRNLNRAIPAQVIHPNPILEFVSDVPGNRTRRSEPLVLTFIPALAVQTIQAVNVDWVIDLASNMYLENCGTHYSSQFFVLWNTTGAVPLVERRSSAVVSRPGRRRHRI